MDLRGQLFTLDLSDDDEGEAEGKRGVVPDEAGSGSRLPSSAIPLMPAAFIGDIQERSATTPPSAPKPKATPTGFPEHRKRTKISSFKQQRAAPSKASADSSSPALKPAAQSSALNEGGEGTFEENERRQIDAENAQRIASMSSAEIEEERAELLSSLDAGLLERLLKRANLDEGRGDTGIELPSEKAEAEAAAAAETERNRLLLKDEDSQKEDGTTPARAPQPSSKRIVPKSVKFEDDTEPANPPAGLQAASDSKSKLDYNHEGLAQPAVHFPTAPTAPELDPSDPSFLENLHAKYFPSLPSDPSKLAWMAPIPTHGSVADQESPYYPAHEALAASALRFDFRGGILPPRIARAMPVSKGLHHHGEAPEAAGYTVPELARLSRSAFPAQRCVAFQTLGRLLYRLGRGEWGGNDKGEISKGLWRCVEEGRVISTLEEAANAEGGHRGSQVYAVEALWLWQKGGGKVWKAS